MTTDDVVPVTKLYNLVLNSMTILPNGFDRQSAHKITAMLLDSGLINIDALKKK